VVLVPSITSKEGVEEATSLSMLEGMACGKVVICTNVGGMKEVIEHMENGILIEQKNPDAIVEAVEFVRKHYDNLEKLREAARDYVVKNHSYLEHAKKILKIYSKVLNENQ
ncbi:MAG TPA: glycosyltransferase family 4 protein, partial [Pseudothermotoga sp.]